MGLPRSQYVREGQEGVYHCMSRCVRRAFLCGFDAVTGRDFSHRKVWLLMRMRYLASVFAIEVCAYAIMANHYHAILRIRPDIVLNWSDWEVARRWLMLFPGQGRRGGDRSPASEAEIRALANCPERIKKLRQRLCSLSWFMGRLNEFIARAANKEDQVKGRFWEGRFKCQVLLDEAAIAACMVYVDLNPVRAGMTESPEESDFTSIRERIEAWREELKRTAAVCVQPRTGFVDARATSSLEGDLVLGGSLGDRGTGMKWLCSISTESAERGILKMTVEEYFNLVDKSGRMLRADKKGSIDANLAPILMRIRVQPEAWRETVNKFGDNFRLAVGSESSLRDLADQLGRRWFKGISSSRIAFVS